MNFSVPATTKRRQILIVDVENPEHIYSFDLKGGYLIPSTEWLDEYLGYYETDKHTYAIKGIKLEEQELILENTLGKYRTMKLKRYENPGWNR